MKNKPNLFDYATSELSQDAILAWLIQWADEQFLETDKHLNQCAKLFVKKLLGKDKSIKIEKVVAGRQWNNIDVWALINEKYFLVIEDKKGTSEHSNQLKRYAELSKKHYEKKDIEVILVYFKMEEQSNFNIIKESGYKVFTRQMMLDILNDYYVNVPQNAQNDILTDYYENIRSLDMRVNSYITLPVSKWDWYSWQGFYSVLSKYINGNWNYVPNRAGGFLGFWWHHKRIKNDIFDIEFYLQLEQNKLTFKLISFNKYQRVKSRDYYRNTLFKKAKELDVDIVRFGRLGKHMGVAKLNSEYRITNENQLLDLQATVENLKRLMQLINETEKEITAHNNGYK